MRVAHIDYDAKLSDFEGRLEIATRNFRDGIQAQNLKVGIESLGVGEEGLKVGNENRDTLKLESQWAFSSLIVRIRTTSYAYLNVTCTYQIVYKGEEHLPP